MKLITYNFELLSKQLITLYQMSLINGQNRYTYYQEIFYFKTITMEERIQTDDNVPGTIINSITSTCSGDRLAIFICQTEGCNDNALMCENSQCDCTKSKHIKCSSKVTMKQFLQNLQKQKRQSPLIRAISEDIINHYNDVIWKLSQDRLEFIQYTKMFGLSQKMMEVFKNLEQGKIDLITGDYTYKMFADEKVPFLPHQMMNDKSIRDYQVQIKSLLNQLAFQIAEQKVKYQMALEQFGQTKSNIKSIQFKNSRREFIPIQISVFQSIEQLNLNQNSIREIKNLEKLINLGRLYLSKNLITEIKGLGKLAKLHLLNLSSNQISQIKGLENLTQLSQLNLCNNKITEIKGLDKLKCLHSLDLTNNQISEIKGLENNSMIQNLHLKYNQIGKIQGLKRLRLSLQRLQLCGNKIKKVENLDYLDGLYKLTLQKNPLEQTIQADKIFTKMKLQGLNKLWLPQHWKKKY